MHNATCHNVTCHVSCGARFCAPVLASPPCPFRIAESPICDGIGPLSVARCDGGDCCFSELHWDATARNILALGIGFGPSKAVALVRIDPATGVRLAWA